MTFHTRLRRAIELGPVAVIRGGREYCCPRIAPNGEKIPGAFWHVLQIPDMKGAWRWQENCPHGGCHA